MQYVYNVNLLRYLHAILGVTKKAITESYNGSPANFIYRIESGTIKIEDLVRICNSFHIPISWFIVPEGKETTRENLPTKDELCATGKEWKKDIESKWQWFGKSYAMSRGISNVEAARECDVATSTFYALFFNEKENWRKSLLKDLLDMVNATHVYPGCLFVGGGSRGIDMIDGYNSILIKDKEIKIIEESYHRKTVSNGNKKDKIIAEKEARIKELEAEIERLREVIRERNVGGYLSMVAEKE